MWIESTGEEMVSTLAIWHMQQNERWLHELKRWYTVSGGYETNTSATKVATNATMIAIRPPTMIRTSMSRPRVSVPSGWPQVGAWAPRVMSSVVASRARC